MAKAKPHTGGQPQVRFFILSLLCQYFENGQAMSGEELLRFAKVKRHAWNHISRLRNTDKMGVAPTTIDGKKAYRIMNRTSYVNALRLCAEHGVTGRMAMEYPVPSKPVDVIRYQCVPRVPKEITEKTVAKEVAKEYLKKKSLWQRFLDWIS